MELPKNITQIGEADAKCKIYVEDYVVSFLKQLNPIARDKTMAAALYGRKKTEEDKTYLFVYGAGKLDFIQKETRHLSQAQMQEIERIRRQYFADYEFLGYRILNGEMVDGFHICEQEICRYVSGYAQFYENNEAMLTYMLESRQEDAAPESVDSEKYDMVRDRQEKRRAKFIQHKKESGKEPDADRMIGKAQKRGMQAAAAALLLLVGALGVSMSPSVTKRVEGEWDKLKTEFQDRKLPSGGEESETYEAAGGTGVGEQIEILTADDTLTEAVQAENERHEAIPVSGRVEVVVNTQEQEEEKADKDRAGNGAEENGQAVNSQAEAEKTAEGQTGNGAEENGQAVNSQAEAGKTAEGQTGNGAEENGQAVNSQAGAEKTAEGQTGNGAEENGQAVNSQPENEKPEQEAMGQAGKEEEGTGRTEAGKDTKPDAYIVCKGDTLTGISLRIYGTESHVKEICKLNRIQNPDAIQIGQKIMLP